MKNRLLAAFTTDGLAAFNPLTELVQLSAGEILFEAFEPVKYLYFPEDAMISLLSETSTGSSIEIAAIGDEGCVGIASLLQEPTVPYKAVVQIPGSGKRIKREVVQKFFEDHLFFGRMVMRYFRALLAQMSQSAICNTFHSIEQRMAKWLLMYADRSGSETLPFTHDFLSRMIGTRRETVTQTLGKFEKLGWIVSSRGSVTISGRDQLETITCECYSIVRNEINRMYAALVR